MEVEEVTGSEEVSSSSSYEEVVEEIEEVIVEPPTSSPPPPVATTTTTTPSTGNEENGDDEVMTATVTQTTLSKTVTWPPKSGGESSSSAASMAASKYMKVVEETQQTQPHSQYTLSRELFKPGKLDERWQQSDSDEMSSLLNGQPQPRVRRNFRSLDQVLQPDQASNTMPSYHVPPGTTRTRKAQENYQRHLEVSSK